MALRHPTLLPDSLRNATFQDVWRYDGCSCDMRPAQKGWKVTFLNRFRHEKKEVENTTFVNRQPGAKDWWEQTVLVFPTLVGDVRGGVASCPSPDLTVLRESGLVTLGPPIPVGLGRGSLAGLTTWPSKECEEVETKGAICKRKEQLWTICH